MKKFLSRLINGILLLTVFSGTVFAQSEFTVPMVCRIVYEGSDIPELTGQTIATIEIPSAIPPSLDLEVLEALSKGSYPFDAESCWRSKNYSLELVTSFSELKEFGYLDELPSFVKTDGFVPVYKVVYTGNSYPEFTGKVIGYGESDPGFSISVSLEMLNRMLKSAEIPMDAETCVRNKEYAVELVTDWEQLKEMSAVIQNAHKDWAI